MSIYDIHANACNIHIVYRFNQVEGQEENAIVTSTGQFVIAWDLAKVKKGKDQYEIKKYDDLVVQDNFRFGDDKEIVSPIPIFKNAKFDPYPSDRCIEQ